ncbi:helix-turn-helix domain-containing protein [Flavobacterium rakeshii]|uniref:Helix-turn-helix domain-containing protein n=1 Tax=Flavobacterium rakeshii TaxID=1038845 RepID=A0A6N8H733_9FLAO|nr:AraC family transcriptional regulator [Flavobacterium rakeshii]MUV02321.1 helix-turn-helix domain-containing protein [Flavobacterium rakeshii]
MIELVLIGLLVLTAATLYIASQIKSVLLFDRICNAFLVFASLQALFALVSIYAGGNYTFMAVPFFLTYGPFKYYAVNSRINNQFSRKAVYVHFIPSFIFCFAYLIVNEFSSLNDYLPTYNNIMFLSVFVSMTSYSVWALLYDKDKNEHDNDPLARKLLNFSSVLVILVSTVSSVYLIKEFLNTDKVNPIIFSSILYLLALFMVAIAFRYKVYSFIAYIRSANDDFSKGTDEEEGNRLVESLSSHPQSISNNIIDVNTESKDVISLKNSPQKYAKSALNESMFEVYEEKLNYFFDDEKVYLDNDISLEVLAEKMKLSKHHLTQLFNVYIGENFNQYINKYRISYSCGLLQHNESEMTIEEVAFESGFNSKVSFNRHFKNIMGCTPSDYTKKEGVA